MTPKRVLEQLEGEEVSQTTEKPLDMSSFGLPPFVQCLIVDSGRENKTDGRLAYHWNVCCDDQPPLLFCDSKADYQHLFSTEKTNRLETAAKKLQVFTLFETLSNE